MHAPHACSTLGGQRRVAGSPGTDNNNEVVTDSREPPCWYLGIEGGAVNRGVCVGMLS